MITTQIKQQLTALRTVQYFEKHFLLLSVTFRKAKAYSFIVM